jgi:CheY-like chemotaxis protein
VADWVIGVAGGVAGAGLALIASLLRRRRPRAALRRKVPPARASVGGAPPAPPEAAPRELLAAWVEFLKDDLGRAVNALHNRLNAIAANAGDLAAAGLSDAQRGNLEQIEREVRRAAKITRGLLRRVSAMAPRSVPAAYGRLEAPLRATPAHLLVVEDDPANREVISKLFTGLGHRVTTASDGYEAYALLERSPVDCIICDVRMPGVSGRTLFEQVEELMPNLSRRFVFVTGDYGRRSTREFLERSGCPVVPKPYVVEELLAGVEYVLRSAGTPARHG